MAALAGALMFLTLAADVSVGREPVAQASDRTQAVLLKVEGAIGPATTLHVRQGLATARDNRAALVIVQLNTPGGLATAMRDIIGDLLASPIPVIAYVSPSGARAASAGTYIVYASHLAAMAPGTHLGAATPVQLGGGRTPLGGPDGKKGDKPAQDAATAKAINDAVAYIRGLAELHGRNADWAENAVRRAASLPARAALEENVIDLVASDLGDLLAKADGRSVRLAGRPVVLSTKNMRVVTIEPNWRVRLLSAITNPNIAYILLLIGFYGILLEFLSPGIVFSGVIGAIALIVALFSLNLLPINFAGVGLLLLGMALMTAEAFTPSFGVLGLGGIAALVLGSLFLFDGEIPGFTLSLPVIAVMTALSAAFLLVAAAAVIRSRRRKVTTGEAELLQSHGEVLRWSDRNGEVLVHGERWFAMGPRDLSPGQRVRVKAREGLKLLVELEPDSRSTLGGTPHAL